MSTFYLLSQTEPLAGKGSVPWVDGPGVFGTSVPQDDMAQAATILDAHAKGRGLRIAKVARIRRQGFDCVYALGEPDAAEKVSQ